MALTDVSINNYNVLKDTDNNLSIDPVDISGLVFPNVSAIPIPTTIPNTALTTKVVSGTGIFDELMSAINNQLKLQYDEGRLTEDTFGEVYATSLTQAMQIGVQFLLSKEQTYYANLLAVEQVKQAKLNEVILKANLERSKLEVHTAYLQAKLTDAQLAEAKAQLGVLNAQYDAILKDNLIKDKEVLIKQEELETAVLNQATITKNNLLLDVQKIAIEKENLVKDKQVLLTQEQIDTSVLNQSLISKNILLAQEQVDTAILNQATMTKNNLILDKNLLLAAQQVESERAKTENTLTDGTAIGGVIARDIALKDKQILLTTRQTTAYNDDFTYRVASMFKDAYSINKTSDSDLSPPTQFNNTEINEVLTKIRNNAGLN